MTDKLDKRPHPLRWMDIAENLLKGSKPYKSGRKRPYLWTTVWCGRCGAEPGQPCIGISRQPRKTAHVIRIYEAGRLCHQDLQERTEPWL
jgi:hypothetical protein